MMPEREGATEQFSRMANELERSAVNFAKVVSASYAFGQSISAFREFEKQLTNTNSAAQGTVEQYNQMAKAARDFALASKSGASEAAHALYELASAGFSVEESLSAMSGVLLLAQASLEPVAESADLVASNIRAFGLEAADSTRVANVLTASILESQATLPKLAFAFRQVAPVAQVANLSIEKTTAALNVLFNIGLRGEQAGTSLRNTIVRLVNPVGQAKDVLDELGIATVGVDGNMRDLEAIMTDIQKKNLSNAALETIFGKEALAGAIALLESTKKAAGDTASAWDIMTGKITGTSSAFVVANKNMDTLDGSLSLAKNSITELGISLGESLAPGIRAAADFINDLAISWRELTDAQRRTGVVIAEIVVAFAALAKGASLLWPQLMLVAKGVRAVGTAIGLWAAIGTKFTALIAALRTGFAALTASLAAAGLAFNPFAVGAIAAGAAIVLLIKGIGGLKSAADSVKGFVSSLTGNFGPETLEPVRLFADDVERQMKRIRLSFSGGDAQSKVDINNAFAAVQKGIGGNLDENIKQFDSLQAQLRELSGKAGKFDAANKALAKLKEKAFDTSTSGYGGTRGFGRNIGKSDFLLDTISNKDATVKQLTTAYTAQLQLSDELSAETKKFFSAGEAGFVGIEAIIAQEKAKGSSPERILEAVKGFLGDEASSVPKVMAEIQNQLGDLAKDKVRLQADLASAIKERENFADDYIAFIIKNAESSDNAVIKAHAADVKKLVGTTPVRNAIKAAAVADKNLERADLDAILVGSIKDGNKGVEEAFNKSAKEAAKLTPIVRKYRADLERRVQTITMEAAKSRIALTKSQGADLAELQRSLVDLDITDAQKEFSDFLFDTLKDQTGLAGFLNSPEGKNLILAIIGQPFFDETKQAMLNTDIDASDFEPIREAKMKEAVAKLGGDGADQNIIALLQEMYDKETTVHLKLKNTKADRNAADAKSRANAAEDMKKAATEFKNDIANALLGAEGSKLELVPSDFVAKREHALSEAKEKLRQSNEKIAIELSAAIRSNPSISKSDQDAFRKAKESENLALFEADVVKINQATQADARAYQVSLNDYFASVSAAVTDTNDKLAELTLIPVNTRVAQLRSDMLLSVRNEAQKALDDEAASFSSRYNAAAGDVRSQNEITAAHKKVEEQIRRKQTAQEDYLATTEAAVAFEKQATEEQIARLEAAGRANDSFVDGARSQIMRLQEEAKGSTFKLGQDIIKSSVQTLGEAFTNLFLGINVSWRDTLRQMAIDILKSQVQSTMSKVLGFAGQVAGAYFGGGSFGGGQGIAARTLQTGNPGFIGPLMSEKGNVFVDGGIMPFANGGVVDRYSEFPMKGGKKGSMAEGNRPEAIMPLKRNSNGQLGVVMTGGQGGGGVVYNSTINVSVAGGSSGSKQQDDEFANTIAKQIDAKVKMEMAKFIVQQQRVGGLLNKGVNS
jgi:TP901 family phage tail tape measure protein